MTFPSSLPNFLRRCFRPIVVACLATAAIITHVPAQTVVPPYVFRHLAGTPGGPGKIDGPGAVARFNHATGVAVDQAGNVYVADSHNETIRKISPAGTVTTFAGSPSQAGSTDGVGSAARFNYPTGPAVDASGNLFVADWANDTVRKVTPAGVVTTVAGSPDNTSIPNGNTDGVGSAARFFGPSSVTVDAAGNVFVADSGNQKIRKIAPDGTVTTLALSGSPGWPAGSIWQGELFGGDPFGMGWGSQATFTYPSQIAVDRAGNLYCGSYQWAPSSYGIPSYFLVLKVDPLGVVTTLSQFPTLTAAPAYLDSSSFAGPALDSGGNLFVGAAAGLLRLDPTGTVTNLTGATTGVGGAGMAVSSTGDCIIADYEQILKITPTGAISILAGLPATPGSADGAAAAAKFKSPGAIAVDANGNSYVADTGNDTIRKITPAGVVTTLAGTAGVAGSADGTGSAAQFSRPGGIPGLFASSMAVDSLGNLYVADQDNSVLRKITAAGVVTTVTSLDVSLEHRLAGFAVDAANNLYFATVHSVSGDFSASTGTISKQTPAGEVSVVATVGPDIEGLAVDRSGNLYVSVDWVVQKIDTGGHVTTLAGSGSRGTVDGPGVSAQFYKLGGLAVDGAGNVFVTDGGSIRRITPDGVVSTLGGSATNVGSEDGLGAAAQFNGPAAVAIDAAGNLYITDTGNHAVRIGQPGGAPVITTQPQNQSVNGGGSVQFSVSASGAPAPTYQWYFKGGAFSGATTNTLSFTNAQATDAGDYTVVVSNALGSVTSSKATLTVSASPVTPPTAPASGGGGGGGGAIDPWFLATLLVLAAAKCWRRTTAAKSF